MAGEEQLERLEAGVAGWNRWREAHPDVGLNLFGADVSAVDL
jgi:hypothetical protein